MAKIFISYRREDAQWQTRALYNALSRHVETPTEDIFYDLDSMTVGLNFKRQIEETVQKCDVLLAVIGRNWLSMTDAAGQRRLNDPNDFVRLEIAAALARNIRVVPVLLDNTDVPPSEDLPDDLKELTERHGVKIRAESFEADAQMLIRGLGLGAPVPAPSLIELPQKGLAKNAPVKDTAGMSAVGKMTDGKQERGTGVKILDVEAAAKRYNRASPENREAAWLELWHARDFTWRGRSEKAALQTEMVEVPASFPDGREAEGDFKTVCLKDYWRWSVGLPDEERLLTDEEMRGAGLLVEVNGETYHLIHAPDMGLKEDEHGKPLKILTDVVSARGKRVPEDIGTDGYGQPNFARALQLRGGWLPGELPRHAGTESAIAMSGARVSDMSLSSMKVGPLNCFKSLFTGEADFQSATFSGKADFQSVSFSGKAYFGSATFTGGAYFGFATFSDGANFGNATFSDGANFGQVTFSGLADFQSVSFSGTAYFGSATFSGGADFGSARSAGSLQFRNGLFKREVSFRYVDWFETNRPNAFRGARFEHLVDFETMWSIPVSALNEAHFEIPPSFRDLTQRQLDEVFRDSINQTKVSIRQAQKAQAEAKRKKEKYEGLTPDQLLAALEGGFRTLKKVAEEKGNFLLSLTYYRFEIRTRVMRPEIAFWEKVAATLYGLSSDYGNSIARPFVSLAVILVGFAAIYLALAIEVNLVDWQDRAALQSGLFQSIDFSFSNVFRPLSALSTDAPREGDFSSLAGKLLNNYGKGFALIVTAISIVQSLTGIVLAFLFVLAVRRRFQIS